MATRKIFLLAPLPAVACGAWVASRYGISPVVFLPNLIAIVLGIPVALLTQSRIFPTMKRWLAPSSLILLLLLGTSLVFPGIDGVKRWIPLGPFHLNISMFISPFVITGFALAVTGRRLDSMILFIGALAIHVFQPDAGQTIALGLAMLASLWSSRHSLAIKLVFALVISGIIVASFYRPDPLVTVPHVERILHLALDLSRSLSLVLLVVLTPLFIPLLFNLRGFSSVPETVRNPGLPLLIYFIATFAITETGNFPVPVIGAGAAGVLGWYATLGLLRFE